MARNWKMGYANSTHKIGNKFYNESDLIQTILNGGRLQASSGGIGGALSKGAIEDENTYYKKMYDGFHKSAYQW